MKKYITILLTSLMMLLPTLSYSHHYVPETAYRQYINNSVWVRKGLQISWHNKIITDITVVTNHVSIDMNVPAIPGGGHVRTRFKILFEYSNSPSEVFTLTIGSPSPVGIPGSGIVTINTNTNHITSVAFQRFINNQLLEFQIHDSDPSGMLMQFGDLGGTLNLIRLGKE